jgi:putative hydrolase of the HAD superfamily
MEAVLFDLDNTLFDHGHSLRCAIEAVRNHYDSLMVTAVDDLVDKYNTALEISYNQYLEKEVSYEDSVLTRVRLFFRAIGLPEPNMEEVGNFRAIYRPAYQANRRATPGSIETLQRLREDGYRMAIVTNGQVQDQGEKAKAIGVYHLVDRLLTSQEAGCAKPDRAIFKLALAALDVPPTHAYMVGDSVDADIRGAVDAGLMPILYAPMRQDARCRLFGRDVPVMRHMSGILDHLGIANSLSQHSAAPPCRSHSAAKS